MERLVQAIVGEVCVHYGIKPGTPMPKVMQVNIEGRIKAYLAETLGICPVSTVVDNMLDRLDIARRQDVKNGLTGRWFENN